MLKNPREEKKTAPHCETEKHYCLKHKCVGKEMANSPKRDKTINELESYVKDSFNSQENEQSLKNFKEV